MPPAKDGFHLPQVIQPAGQFRAFPFLATIQQTFLQNRSLSSVFS